MRPDEGSPGSDSKHHSLVRRSDQLWQTAENARPGQVPFGCLLPREVDNLLVVTTVSTTHVGWGTLRQTPTQMHLAESAAWAVVMAKREGIAPAALEVTRLQQCLVENGVMITFFNDLDMAGLEPWVPAMQYLGTKGLFPTYEAQPQAPLAPAERWRWERWAEGLLPRAAARLNLAAAPTRAAACAAIYRAMNAQAVPPLSPRVPADAG